MKNQNSLLIELHYLPNIAYFSLLNSFSSIILEQFENYHKSSYRNRCYIAGPNGKQRLSIPLQKDKNKQLNVRKTAISYDQNWHNVHLNSIRAAYGKSPYFDYYFEEFDRIYKMRPAFLFDLNLMLFEKIITLIGLNKSISYTSRFEKNIINKNIYDFRNQVSIQQKEVVPISQKKYSQVFESKNGFLTNMSILDLLFCTGPESILYL